MNKKNVTLFVISLFAVLILINNVLAITGSIGNARMILREPVGSEIEKYILVKNVNDVSVDIRLFASGDLEDYIVIHDDEFTLEPGGEKKAYFTIEIPDEKTSETNINIEFTPTDGKNGVGLSSTVIVIPEENNDILDEEDEEMENDVEEENKGDNLEAITGIFVNNYKNIQADPGLIILTAMTLIIFIFFIGLLIFKRKIEKNYENKESKTKPKKSVKKRG